MKNIFIVVFISILSCDNAFSQILPDSVLVLKDFETALTDPDYLRKILMEHDFNYEKFSIEDCILSECWKSELQTETISKPGLIIKNPVINICIYAFKPNLGPRNGVISSIDIQIYKDPVVEEGLNKLIEVIGKSYPDKEITIAENSNQSMVFRKIGSAIEVELVKSRPEFSYYDWYFLVFYLYESPHF
jgi:hypothetical protein